MKTLKEHLRGAVPVDSLDDMPVPTEGTFTFPMAEVEITDSRRRVVIARSWVELSSPARVAGVPHFAWVQVDSQWWQLPVTYTQTAAQRLGLVP